MMVRLPYIRIKLCLLLFISLALNAGAEEAVSNSQPPIKDLGGNQYQVGQISIDKNKAQFRVPGKVIRTEPPIEFLAVTKGGMKAYESVLELEVNAFEFNLACILIGLDAENAVMPDYHFDEKPIKGDRVEVYVEWQENDRTVSIPIAELLSEGEKEPKPPTSEWVYTGSVFLPDGIYLAALDGVLIGFVHDPSTIIEHRTGVGMGSYGSIMVSKKAPALDAQIVVVVSKTGN